MLELSVSGMVSHNGFNLPKQVKVGYYERMNSNDSYDMSLMNVIMAGEYIEENDLEFNRLDSRLLQTISNLPFRPKNFFIFTDIIIHQEVPNIPVGFINVENYYSSDEVDISATLMDVMQFRRALRLLKRRADVEEISPVSVDSIFLLVLNGSEEDVILRHEAIGIASIKAGNLDLYHLYCLREWMEV